MLFDLVRKISHLLTIVKHCAITKVAALTDHNRNRYQSNVIQVYCNFLEEDSAFLCDAVFSIEIKIIYATENAALPVDRR